MKTTLALLLTLIPSLYLGATASPVTFSRPTEHRVVILQKPYEGTKPGVHLTGVFVDIPHAGFQLLNPLAPKEYGYGEKYAAWPTGPLTSVHYPDGPSGLRQVDRQSGPGATRETGGIKLFGFEF